MCEADWVGLLHTSKIDESLKFETAYCHFGLGGGDEVIVGIPSFPDDELRK